MELFGFKHISNEERGLEEPIYYKSRGARRVLEHYRHPVAVGPLVLLLSCKVMTTDRLLLAAVFVLYTFCRTYLDYQDYLYLRYVSYPARRYTFQKVEIRSRSTTIRETQSSFCFSDEDDCDVTHCDVIQTPGHLIRRPSFGSDTDAGYGSSPTYHKPDYFRILSQTKSGKKVVETEVASASVEKEITTSTSSTISTSSTSGCCGAEQCVCTPSGKRKSTRIGSLAKN